MKKFKEKAAIVNKYIDTYLLNPLKVVDVNLHDIVSHAISGGKRLRSVITLVVGECLNPKINLVKLALAVELLHNSSLILDDMPCMDNDTHRRGKETIHYKYGPQKAQLLVAYLLRKSYELIHSNYKELIDWRRENDTSDLNNLEIIIFEVYDTINKNMGYLGAAMGQFIDICPMNSRIDVSAYKKYYSSVVKLMDLIYLKTTTFFEIGFMPAYLICASTNLHTDENRDRMRRIVRYFGLAFQISDDYEDVEQDLKRVDKEYNPNLICKFGEEEAYSIYTDAILQFKTLCHDIGISHCIFDELCDFLNTRVDKQRSIYYQLLYEKH